MPLSEFIRLYLNLFICVGTSFKVIKYGVFEGSINFEIVTGDENCENYTETIPFHKTSTPGIFDAVVELNFHEISTRNPYMIDLLVDLNAHIQTW